MRGNLKVPPRPLRMREPKGSPTPPPFHVMLLYRIFVQNICCSLRSLMRGTDWSAKADLSPSVARCIGFNHMANLFFFILYKKEKLLLPLPFPLFFGLFPFFTFRFRFRLLLLCCICNIFIEFF